MGENIVQLTFLEAKGLVTHEIDGSRITFCLV